MCETEKEEWGNYNVHGFIQLWCFIFSEWYMNGQILIVVVSISVILPLALMKHLGKWQKVFVLCSACARLDKYCLIMCMYFFASLLDFYLRVQGKIMSFQSMSTTVLLPTGGNQHCFLWRSSVDIDLATYYCRELFRPQKNISRKAIFHSGFSPQYVHC